MNKDYKTYYSYYEYDELHRVTKSTDPFGIVKEYTYVYDDEFKKMEVSVKEYNNDYPSKYKYVKNSYDLSGRISSMGDQRHDYKAP